MHINGCQALVSSPMNNRERGDEANIYWSIEQGALIGPCPQLYSNLVLVQVTAFKATEAAECSNGRGGD